VVATVRELKIHTSFDSDSMKRDIGVRRSLPVVVGCFLAASTLLLIDVPASSAGHASTAESGGDVLGFGDAADFGSLAGMTLDHPVVGMASSPDGNGYWLVGSDGGVFSFGDAPFKGSAAGQSLLQPVVSMVRTPSGSGYWMAEGLKGLVGKVVVIDPGHNGGNGADPAYIDQLVWNGREEEACDTTGTETASGYTEAEFNFNVAQYLAADLEAQGATVVLTRNSNTGVGPCVTERAAIGNQAHANAAVAIHADGGPPRGRGFAILEPVADGPNNAVIGASDLLGTDLRNSFLAGTGEPVSSYDGVNGIQPRDDLGGLNLTTVPKVFIECANMAIRRTPS
jgi:N-acetylmuramoyl-L-alanine amidase